MALTTAFPTSCKSELFNGTHNFGDAGTSPIGGNAFKLTLVKATPAGTYGAATTNYSDVTGNSDEATDTASPQGYTAGGGTLTNNGEASSGTTAYVDWADLTFSSVNLSADGCVIYNSTQGNRAVYVGDFGGTKTASGGDFTIQFPTADASNAILRLA